MKWKRSVVVMVVGLGALITVVAGTIAGVAEAAPSTTIATGCTSSSAVAVVPGNKAGFPAIPILLVTSCFGSLQFIDPFNPTTPVLTVSTSTRTSLGALAFRPGTPAAPQTPDLLGCVPGEGGTSLYAIHFSPLDSATPGTSNFLAGGPPGSNCAGIAWDPGDQTVYQTSFASGVLHFAFAPPPGTGITTPTSIPDGCGSSLTGVGVVGARLFVGCAAATGTSPTVRQFDKSGTFVRSFAAPASSFSGLPDDAGSFSAQFQEALWTLVGNQFVAIFVPRLFPVQAGGCPPGYPTNPDGTAMDSDGDGLLDCWEATVWPAGTTAPGGPVGTNIWPDGLPGIDIDGDGVRDIVLCVTNVNGLFECADPNVKDIFVEFDSMVNQPPNLTALNQVVTAFANAPVDNPAPGGTGPPGVRLHIQIDDQNVPFTLNTALTPCTPPTATGDSAFDVVKPAWFGTASERGLSDTPSEAGQRSKTLFAKRLVFHYGLSVHNLTRISGNSPSGCAEIPGNDFVVSLGSFGAGNGTTDQWAGTFMHELGHNLGLFHGGGDRSNCKPNYLSVMSYTRQFPSIITSLSGHPNYSGQLLPDLNKTALLEGNGIGGPSQVPTGAQTTFGGQTSPFTAIVPQPDATGFIDWDAPPTTSSPIANPVTANINSIGNATGCDGAGGPVLTGFNDWANLVYNFRRSYDFGEGQHSSTNIEREITALQAKQLADLTDLGGTGLPSAMACGPAPQGGPCSIIIGIPQHTVFLFNNNGVPTAIVPAAVLSTVGFDATTVNPSTVTLQGTPVAMVFGKPACAIRDINGDGLPDLVCAFVKTGLGLGYETAVVEGRTFVGKAIRGQDFMNVVPAPAGVDR